MKLRHALSWKSWYYQVVLPGLRRLGPEAGDAILTALGRAIVTSPSRRREIARAVGRARAILGADWDESKVCRDVASNLARFAARDYPLDGVADQDTLKRFDINGANHPRHRSGPKERGDPGRQSPGSPRLGAALALSPRGAAPAPRPAAQARFARPSRSV